MKQHPSSPPLCNPENTTPIPGYCPHKVKLRHKTEKKVHVLQALQKTSRGEEDRVNFCTGNTIILGTLPSLKQTERPYFQVLCTQCFSLHFSPRFRTTTREGSLHEGEDAPPSSYYGIQCH